MEVQSQYIECYREWMYAHWVILNVLV